MKTLGQTTKKSNAIAKQKMALQVKANSTLEKLNFLIELVYNSKMGAKKQRIQNQFLQKFGEELPNKNFYRYVERVSFLQVEKSWVSINTTYMEDADQYVSEFLPETFYSVHPRMVA